MTERSISRWQSRATGEQEYANSPASSARNSQNLSAQEGTTFLPKKATPFWHKRHNLSAQEGTTSYEVKGTTSYEVKGTTFYEVKGSTFYEVKGRGNPCNLINDL